MIPFYEHAEYQELLNEGRYDDLKSMALKYINDLDSSADSARALEDVMSALNTPIINKNLDTWAKQCGLSGLPLIDTLKGIFIRANELTFEEKVKMTERMASGEPLMSVQKIINDSHKGIKKVSSYYTDKKACEFVMNKTRNMTDASLLRASTNIGAGEVSFIVLGNLSKPKLGDLEVPGIGTVEVKTPGAGIAPKNLVHPSKVILDVAKNAKKITGIKDLKFPTDFKEAAALMSVKKLRASGKKQFPLGDYFRENKYSLIGMKKLFDYAHDKIYKKKLNVSQFINSDYSLNFDKYGAYTFMEMFMDYKQQTRFDTLMYYDYNTERMYCITSRGDAEEFYKKYGQVELSFGDKHGRDQKFGGKISSGKTVFA